MKNFFLSVWYDFWRSRGITILGRYQQGDNHIYPRASPPACTIITTFKTSLVRIPVLPLIKDRTEQQTQKYYITTR